MTYAPPPLADLHITFDLYFFTKWDAPDEEKLQQRDIASNACNAWTKTRLSEHFSDLPRKVLQGKGFLQESGAILDRTIADDSIFGIT